MNGYERISRVLAGERPDTTPVMLHNFMLAAREAGYTQHEYREDPNAIADTFIRSVDTYGYDGVLLDIDTVTLAGAVGVPVELPDNEPGVSRTGCLRSLGEVPRLVPRRLTDYRYVVNWLEAARLLVDRFGGEIYVRGNCDQAPFSLASMMRSLQEWMTDLYDEPNRPLVLELLDYCCDHTCQFIELMAETGVDMVSNGDSPAGPAMISPEMYREFAFPLERRVVEKAHACGVRYALHICGNTNSIVRDMVDTGADAVELDYLTDVALARDACEGRATFIGNIDPSGVLALGSVADVERTVDSLLELFDGEPRFILNAGCAIPSSTPSENLHALIRTARRHRKQPAISAPDTSI